jgi:hypothetical protein
LREHSVAAVSRPRYVGANAFTPPRRASDAITSDEPETSGILKPLMRAIIGDEPKVQASAPKLESAGLDAVAAPAPASRTIAPEPVSLQRNESSQGLPIVVARNEPVTPAAPNETARPSNKEIENLVVALVAYYEAGDARAAGRPRRWRVLEQQSVAQHLRGILPCHEIAPAPGRTARLNGSDRDTQGARRS